MVGSLTKVSNSDITSAVNTMNSGGDQFKKIEELNISHHIRESTVMYNSS